MDKSISFKYALENMSQTLRAMAGLKTCRSISFAEGGFALATGTDSASENWAFSLSRKIDGKTAGRVCSFFDELSLPFIWPVFPEAASDKKILEDAGMLPRGELQVMARPNLSIEESGTQSPLAFEYDSPDLWAETAWRAFDSPPGAPGSFVKLARGLNGSENFFLLTAKRDARPVGTAMFTLSGGLTKTAGIYYFATLPEERKKGVGDAMMRETSRRAFEQGCRLLTLQATPSGAPFYASRGFEPLLKLPLYSFSQEVF